MENTKHTPISGWEVITNKRGVEMAVVNRDALVETLKQNKELPEALQSIIEIRPESHEDAIEMKRISQEAIKKATS